MKFKKGRGNGRHTARFREPFWKVGGVGYDRPARNRGPALARRALPHRTCGGTLGDCPPQFTDTDRGSTKGVHIPAVCGGGGHTSLQPWSPRAAVPQRGRVVSNSAREGWAQQCLVVHDVRGYWGLLNSVTALHETSRHSQQGERSPSAAWNAFHAFHYVLQVLLTPTRGGHWNVS